MVKETRPDTEYWESSPQKRKSCGFQRLREMTEELEKYYKRRFVLGGRFFLSKSYCGIPKGARCTVVDTWPNTMVRWDKWSQKGYGSLRRSSAVSYELDMVLVHES